jgi:dipeptidyl aminopeptidase/acylaminoacyl peptidase
VVEVASGAAVAITPSRIGGTVSDLSWRDDGRALCAVESSPVASADLWLRPLEQGESSRLSALMPAALAAQPLVDPVSVWFSSGDGLNVGALLFVPADVGSDDRRPGLVYVHGGPTWQVARGWLPEVQHLVARGYTVIAPNFRGSTGYGRDYDRANDGDWGGGDLEDCVAAAGYLRGLPWIAADRIGIWGGSYGGYMTLLAIGKRPDVFQAGVDLYGSSDEATLWMQTDGPGRRGIEEEVGVPLLGRSVFQAGAPLRYAGQIRAPLLMLHGEEDRRVTLEQSEAMRRALERLGKTFEYHRYPAEPHGFRRIDNWVDAQERTVDFLGRYL